jgi:hypothetical protein
VHVHCMLHVNFFFCFSLYVYMLVFLPVCVCVNVPLSLCRRLVLASQSYDEIPMMDDVMRRKLAELRTMTDSITTDDMLAETMPTLLEMIDGLAYHEAVRSFLFGSVYMWLEIEPLSQVDKPDSSRVC